MNSLSYLFKKKTYIDIYNGIINPDIQNEHFLAGIKPASELNAYLVGMKNTILNLIYPAILGAIIYGIIAYTPDPFTHYEKMCSYWQGSNENKVSIFSLVGIILFFLCDYLHLYVVRSYSKSHFLIHLFTSLVLLEAALYFLPDGAGGDPAGIIEKYGRVFWTFFFISKFYLLHDVLLLRKADDPAIHPIERPLYKGYAWVNGIFFLFLIIVLIRPLSIETKLLHTIILIVLATIFYFFLLTRKHKIEMAKSKRRKELTVLDCIKAENGVSTEIKAINEKVNDVGNRVTTLNTGIDAVEHAITAVNEKIENLKEAIKTTNNQLANLESGSADIGIKGDTPSLKQ